MPVTVSFIIIFKWLKSQYLVLFTVKTQLLSCIVKLHKSVFTLRNVMLKASLALHGSRSPGLESHADEEPPLLSGYSPKVVLHRIPVTDVNTSTSTSSPARVSTAASRQPADHQVCAVICNQITVLCTLLSLLFFFINITSSIMQFSENSLPISSLDTDKDPVQVSQFFLDDIFTEVVDPDWFLFETSFTAAIPVYCTRGNNV